MLDLVLLLVGFAPLIFGANLLVDSSSSLAKRFNIPNIVIGLTIVAFGTSAPELVVNTFAAIDKDSDIVMGNIIGSNIFNIMVILGIASIIYPLTVKSNTTWIEVPLTLLAAVLVIIIINDQLLEGRSFSEISRIDGIILLLFFIIFMAYNLIMMKKGDFSDEMEVKNYKVIQSILYIIGGIAMLVIGGKLIVNSAEKIAINLGISQRVIALTIISIGTSLPELATSIVAARKRNVDIAIGNVVGSNIFNIFFILGVSSVINPVRLQPLGNFDLMVNILASVLLFIFIFLGKGRQIDRSEGVFLLLLYVFYIITLIFDSHFFRFFG